jgi:superfamily II DNA/RNA helicase
LIGWLNEHIRPNGAWDIQRVIIFTEYRDTQNWLQSVLASEGLTGGDRLITMYGGMDSKDRERIKAAFQTDPKNSPVRILLATDAASEGIDLQNHCSRMIHFEIPWNPNRLEQRNGRIDRHGQRASACSSTTSSARGTTTGSGTARRRRSATLKPTWNS